MAVGLSIARRSEVRPTKIVVTNCALVQPLGRVRSMNVRTLSMYVLRALAEAQTEGRRENLETLVGTLHVRRRDVRSAVTALHRQGLVDALHMGLTLAGFALGRSLMATELPALRVPAPRSIVAA
jgi:hypothetical protein